MSRLVAGFMIDPFHLEAYGVTTVNYNRDIEIFPVLEAMFKKIYGECPYKSPTDMYQDIRPIVQQYDLAAINQETIFVNDPAQYSNYPYFGSPTAVGTALAEMGFDIVTQATNHCYDKLDRGILDTVGFWRENYPGMTVLGIHDSQADADTIRVVERSGIRLAMLNYTYGLNYSVPANKYMVDTLDDPDKIAADIEKAKAKSDLVIVFVHWGTEDSTVPSADQRSWAQFFADHGVGLVIGSGPHALQPMQTVTGADGNEVPVYYSLGNFLSHQKDPLNMDARRQQFEKR